MRKKQVKFIVQCLDYTIYTQKFDRVIVYISLFDLKFYIRSILKYIFKKHH